MSLSKVGSSEEIPGEVPFQFVANQLAINFANTKVLVDGRSLDLLDSFNALVRWLEQARAVDSQEAAATLHRFSDRLLGASALADARRLRTGVEEIIAHAIAGKSVPHSALEKINSVLTKADGYREVVRNPAGFELRFKSQRGTSAQLLAPVAASAADLLVSGDLRLIRKCENPECILHIYDTTKNHSRRWCSMATCGNRHKVNAFRERARTAG